ncbi:MAG: TolB family protein [Cyclobacteriaceae bacterium]
MKQSIPLLIYFITTVGYPQQPPGTDIYLFDLKKKKGAIILSNPKNITARPGYDNQPFFHPDKPILYYASADDEGRTDILQYNYESGTTRRLTETPEREYSPTVTPDKNFISCIIQRDNGAQDLGKYPIDGGDPVVLINNLTVGYHAWVDHRRVLTFVLPQPFTLQLIDVETGKTNLLAENIGRSLHKIPREEAMSFVQQQPDKTWAIKKLNTSDLSMSNLVVLTTETEPLLAWMPDGTLLRSMVLEIYAMKPGKDKVWKKVDLQLALKGITRMAVNLKGDKMAVVVSE